MFSLHYLLLHCSSILSISLSTLFSGDNLNGCGEGVRGPVRLYSESLFLGVGGVLGPELHTFLFFSNLSILAEQFFWLSSDFLSTDLFSMELPSDLLESFDLS